ncbi:hypothetical protein BZG36_05413 [Bifiguratus adelaidae]|uniref:Protein kinase domain-containing protein n=1 Tax=Bifiguratus adelaidae TaxID=1938954 RepID=A0A261XTG2_9FUNG|nr:hypothetical protein BZG36_05413 [Bifiguratus adelaidae]
MGLKARVDTVLHAGHAQPKSYEKIKNYAFGKVVGTGTYGEVKEATRLSDGQVVAVKIVRKKRLSGCEDLVDREMEALQGLHHPNVIHFLDWFESRDKYYLVFEMASGGELFARIVERGRFSEKDAAHILGDILSGVAYLHEHHVIHRDLKPENLIYKDYEPDAKLLICDFGVAKLYHDDNEIFKTMCGSPGYKGHGKPVDMWSIGVITYTLLCGYNPFQSDDEVAFLQLIKDGKYEFHDRYWKHISDDAKDFIRKLLQPDPSARLTAEQALAHRWITHKEVPEHNLLEHTRENLCARAKFRAVVDDIRVAQSLEHHHHHDDGQPHAHRPVGDHPPDHILPNPAPAHAKDALSALQERQELENDTTTISGQGSSSSDPERQKRENAAGGHPQGAQAG